MHEQRQRRHLEALPLGLARPVQERRLHAFQRRHRVGQSAQAQQHRPIGTLQFPRLRKVVWRRQRGGVLDAREQEGRGLARRIGVPVQRGGEGLNRSDTRPAAPSPGSEAPRRSPAGRPRPGCARIAAATRRRGVSLVSWSPSPCVPSTSTPGGGCARGRGRASGTANSPVGAVCRSAYRTDMECDAGEAAVDDHRGPVAPLLPLPLRERVGGGVSGPLRNGNPRGDPNAAARCAARTRSGCPCRSPAMRNGRCRMHGGRSTGPKTEAGLARLREALTTHGFYGRDGRTFRTFVSALLAQGRPLRELAHRPAGTIEPAELRALFRLTSPPAPGPVRTRQSADDGGKTPCTVRMRRVRIQTADERA